MNVPKKFLATRSLAAILRIVGYLALVSGIIATGFGLMNLGGTGGVVFNAALTVGAIAGGIVLMLFGVIVLLMAEQMIVLIDIEHNTRRSAEIQSPTLSQPTGCPSCGADARTGDKFCQECGSALMEEMPA